MLSHNREGPVDPLSSPTELRTTPNHPFHHTLLYSRTISVFPYCQKVTTFLPYLGLALGWNGDRDIRSAQTQHLMENHPRIASTGDPGPISTALVRTPTHTPITANRFPEWMDRHNTWILAIFGAMTLVTFLCLGWTADRIHDRLVQSAGHSLVQAATDAASKLDMMVLERYRDMRMLATTPITHSQDHAALTTYLRELQRSNEAYRWIGVTDSRGILIAATDPSKSSQDRSRSPWFQLARTITGVTILDAQANEEIGGTSAITLVTPLRDSDGKFQGAIAAVVGLPSLMALLDDTMKVLKNIEWTEQSHIEYQLLNEQGDLIADSSLRRESHLNLKQLGLPSAILVGLNARGFIEETHLRRGTSVITAYAQLTIEQATLPLRWGVLIRVDQDSVLAPIRSFLWKLAGLALLILLPMLGLVLGMIKALHEEWRTAKRESLRATDAESALRKRTEALDTLVAAAQNFSEQQDLNSLLHTLLDIAKKSTDARYVALWFATDSQRGPGQFLSIGIDDAAAQAIQALPLEQEARESLGQKDGILSLKHLAKHWTSRGFPADYAPMASYLGISIRSHGRFFGRLSLANKLATDGLAPAFHELDEQIVFTLATQAGTAIQNLQLLHDSKEQAKHDSLTELLNHSAILNALEQELSRAERTRQPVGVLIADLDHFKRVNDTYGHQVGDTVLRETAQRLRETARSYDHVGRAGGEEFLIVVPNCDLEALRECAERYRAAISDRPFNTPSGPLTITVSIGATVCAPEYPLSSELLRKMADYALYRVKSRGRNGVDIVPHPHALLAEQKNETV